LFESCRTIASSTARPSAEAVDIAAATARCPSDGCIQLIFPPPEDECYEENPARLTPADGFLYVQTATTVHAQH
jgi:hypothetical protein